MFVPVRAVVRYSNIGYRQACVLEQAAEVGCVLHEWLPLIVFALDVQARPNSRTTSNSFFILSSILADVCLRLNDKNVKVRKDFGGGHLSMSSAR